MSDDSISEELAYEARLQRRLKILITQFEAGNVKIATGLDVIESLKRIRYSSDGCVDLSTVDGMVRSLALAVEAAHDRAELKKSASLFEIQNTYFEFLNRTFRSFYDAMIENDLNPHQAGISVSRSPSTVSEINRVLPEFMDAIENFWGQCGETAIAHVEDMNKSLKAVFGGDLFPTASENIASKCSLYMDTIVLPDPFLRSRIIFDQLSDESKAHYFIKHGLNLLKYRDLACADLMPPIVVVLPNRSELNAQQREFFHKLGKDDAVIHAQEIFGRKFNTIDELSEFCKNLNTIEKLTSEVKNASRILFDTEWPRTVVDQISLAAKTEESSVILGTPSPGVLILSQAIGRMGSANELLLTARSLGASPIIDAPTSWQYFVWKLEYDSTPNERSGLGDLHTVRGLQTLADNDMRWLGRVPPAALIEVRKAGALDEVRAILSKGVEELASTNPVNFHRTSDLVFDNIQAAFTDHQNNIDKLSQKGWKFAGSEIGSWVVVGSLAATAAVTGTPTWALAALAADQILKAPKLHEIPKSVKNLIQERNKLNKSPVGIMFKYSKLYS